MVFDIIVSFEKKTFACGLNNKLPWNYKPDLKNFKSITTTPKDKINLLIVGYKTFINLPSKFQALNRRFILVVDKKRGYSIPEHFKNTVLGVCETFIDAYNHSVNIEHNETFVIGGTKIYQDALNNLNCRYIYAGIFNLNKIVYDRIFPLESLNFLKKIEDLVKEHEINEEDLKGTYEFSKYKFI